jgi:ABC-2 type transport system ATP-binding protein
MSAAAEPAVEIRGLRKAYGSVEAVRGIDLQVECGEVFALLGPNGAGKTTTVEILEGHRRRTAGEVSVLGHDPEDREPGFRERIGIVLQATGVEPYLTVAEVIELYAGYYPRRRPIDEVLELTGLAELRDRRVGRLSGGQRRRVDVAVALAGDPELLFLDEPTTGFDPSARRLAWGTIRGLAVAGTTVMLTTHAMDEAQALADRVAIIVDGRIVAGGRPADLIRESSRVSRISFRIPDDVELPVDVVARRDGSIVELETEAPTRVLASLFDWARSVGVAIDELEVVRRSLEDVYLELTGRPVPGPEGDD